MADLKTIKVFTINICYNITVMFTIEMFQYCCGTFLFNVNFAIR
ncbi:hypothetical protein FHS10_000080 [Mucilaginibacter dorajii]|nr:hypothetical protein [Mucilaginibacter dorajii]